MVRTSSRGSAASRYHRELRLVGYPYHCRHTYIYKYIVVILSMVISYPIDTEISILTIYSYRYYVKKILYNRALHCTTIIIDDKKKKKTL